MPVMVEPVGMFRIEDPYRVCVTLQSHVLVEPDRYRGVVAMAVGAVASLPICE
jgi:hypothetical protein